MPPAPENLSLPKARFSFADCAYAELTLQDADVISWVPVQGREQLFFSRASAYRPGVPICDEVPEIFQQIGGRGPLARHGFTRNLSTEMHNRERSLFIHFLVL